MKILSIETSCDDTAISIMEAKGDAVNASFGVLANNSNSQINIHIPYGGVYPKLAKREHAKNLPIILKTCLEQAKLDKKNKPVDVIAVTYGPGLEMCLWEGITFAQELAKKWDVPVIPVNHMEGHVLSVFGKSKGKFKIPKIEFPVLSLLVSGGHTQLVLTKKWMRYKIIGKTLDDAVGEAFDKVARMLGLPYPGGPEISKLAKETRKHIEELENFSGPRFSGSPSQPDHEKSSNSSRAKKIGLSRERSIAQAGEPSIVNFQQKIMRAESARKSDFSLPRPMLHSKNFDFSFSGLKTAVLYLIKKIGKLDEKTKSKIALEFENSAIECLVHKTQKAAEKYGAKTLIVAGGVAGNAHLQREMKKIIGHAKGRAGKKIKILLPAKGLAGDNSLMIGIAGYLNYIKNKNLFANKTEKTSKLGVIKAVGDLKL